MQKEDEVETLLEDKYTKGKLMSHETVCTTVSSLLLLGLSLTMLGYFYLPLVSVGVGLMLFGMLFTLVMDVHN